MPLAFLRHWAREGVGDAVRSGVVRQDALFKDGKPTKVIERPGKRAWAVGGYIF